jgi:sucrose-phosphate synthase
MRTARQVQQLLSLPETDIERAWERANISAHRQMGERDYRLSYVLWRVWYLRRKKALVDFEEAQRSATDLEPESVGEMSEVDALLLDESTEDRDSPRDSSPPHSPRSPHGGSMSPSRSVGRLLALSETRLPPLPEDDQLETMHGAPLYIVMASLHGLVRGTNMELGRDADTGGQVKYVVELARALARTTLGKGVHRVDLLTRLITDPSVDEAYGVPEEHLLADQDPPGGAYIVRLPAGDPMVYARKELLWPHLREFADHAIQYVTQQQQRLQEQLGVPCRVLCLHGHYADAAEAMSMVAASLGCPVFVTGHSLGKNKLDSLLREGKMTRSEIETQYHIGRRIEAEERALDHAAVVVVSTEEEITHQWGLYSGYNSTLERALARSLRFTGRAMPLMKVIPPGLDFRDVVPHDPDAPLPVGDDEPAIWRDIARWLRNPRKPAILAIARAVRFATRHPGCPLCVLTFSRLRRIAKRTWCLWCALSVRDRCASSATS